MTDFDATDAAVIAFMGEDVTFTPDGGGPVVIKGLFQAPDDDVDGGEIDMETIAPIVTVLNTDATAPSHGDKFTIRQVPYAVKRVEVDESALVVFHLLEDFSGLFAPTFSQEFD